MKPLCCALLLLTMAAPHPVPFESSTGWGYKDNSGQVVIGAQFVRAEPFSPEGLAAVVDSEGWACINVTGKVLIRPLVVDNGPDYFHENLARFREDGKIGFFNRSGEVAIQPTFDFAMPFSEGLAAVCNGCREVPAGEHTTLEGGQWGYIDPHGALAIPLTYDRAESFSNGRARVNTAGKWLRINRNGMPAE